MYFQFHILRVSLTSHGQLGKDQVKGYLGKTTLFLHSTCVNFMSSTISNDVKMLKKKKIGLEFPSRHVLKYIKTVCSD